MREGSRFGVGGVMELRTKADVKLVGRAISENWEYDKGEVIEALRVALRDPDLSIDAAKVFAKLDEVNIKRRLAELRIEEANEKQRLRLLEFARSLSPDELARLSQQSGVRIGEARREDASS